MASYNWDELWKLKPSKVVLELQQQYVDALKPKEKAKIKELRQRVSDVLKPHHNDYYLLKWLRARKFDLSASENMLRTNLKWREEFRVDHIHEEFTPSDTQRKYTTQGLFGKDRDGNPVWIFPLGNIDVRGLARAAKLSDIVRYFVYTLELNERAKWYLTEQCGKVIHNLTCIFDLDNFKFKEFVWKPAFDMIIQLLKIFEGSYPESLHRAFGVNAPKIFSIFYNLVKPFISEDTKTKIQIFGRDGWKEAILKIIDPNQLPKHWGGNLVDEVDGNPYCSTHIPMGGTIPQSLYLTLSSRVSDDACIKTANIDRGATYTFDIIVDQPGSTLNWIFQTDSHDIGFGINFKPNNGKIMESSQKVLPIERVECNMVPEDGDMICDDAGTYTIVFDNSFSWYRGKQVHYEINVIAPDSEKDSMIEN